MRSHRQDGQGTVDEIGKKEDLRAALEEKERKHLKSKGINFEGADAPMLRFPTHASHAPLIANVKCCEPGF